MIVVMPGLAAYAVALLVFYSTAVVKGWAVRGLGANLEREGANEGTVHHIGGWRFPVKRTCGRARPRIPMACVGWVDT